MFKVKVLIVKILQRCRKGGTSNPSSAIKCQHNKQDMESFEEIAQNLANELVLQAAAQHLVFCLQTTAGSFYWEANADAQ